MKKFAIGRMPFAELDERTGVVIEGPEALERLGVYFKRPGHEVELADAGGVGVRLVVAEMSRCGSRTLALFGRCGGSWSSFG